MGEDVPDWPVARRGQAAPWQAPGRATAVAFGALVAVVAGFALWRMLGGASEDQITFVTDVTFPIAGVLATFLGLGVSRSRQLDGATRRAWQALVVSLIAYLLGDVLWACLELTGGEAPLASVPDVFYLLFYPIALLGLLRLPGARRTRVERVQLVIDVLTLALAGVMVEWIVVLGPELGSIDASPESTILAIAYPIADVVLLLGLAVVLLRRRLVPQDLPLALLVAAIVANLAGDLVSGVAVIADTFATGGLADACFMLFWLLIGSSAYAQARDARAGLAPRSDRSPSAVFWLPYVATGVGFGLLVVTELNDPDLTRDTMVAGAVGLTFLVVIRQVIGARQNARYAARQATMASEARFSTLVQQATDIITVVRADGTILSQSPSCLRILGVDPAGHLGRRIADLAHPDDRAALATHLERAAGEVGVAPPFEWRMAARDGSWVSVETIAANLAADPVVQGLVLTSRDVTERLRLEAELNEARKMEAIGRLAGGVAHDFNNLLTGIHGFAEFLMADLDIGDPRRTDAVEIRRAAERAAQLTRELLAFGRRQVVHPVPLDLRDVVTEALPLLGRLVGEDVDVVAELGEAVPPVLADRSQVVQILLNLAANARDAMPDGGTLVIAVRTAPLDPFVAGQPAGAPRAHVQLVVSDTGIGMDEATRAHLFEPFFTTKAQGKGTGLGLASVYGIVRQAGGRISAESVLGRGSTFRIDLPATDAEVGSEVAATPVAALAATETILLVEDEPGVRSVAQRMLERSGHRVRSYGDPGEALAFAIASPGSFDALVTDVTMPGLSGPALAERLESLRPGLPVLFISGHARLEVPGRCLAKPFAAEELTSAVRELLDAARAADGAASSAA